MQRQKKFEEQRKEDLKTTFSTLQKQFQAILLNEKIKGKPYQKSKADLYKKIFEESGFVDTLQKYLIDAMMFDSSVSSVWECLKSLSEGSQSLYIENLDQYILNNIVKPVSLFHQRYVEQSNLVEKPLTVVQNSNKKAGKIVPVSKYDANHEAEKIANNILSRYTKHSRLRRGETALYEAIQTGNYKVVEIILNTGVNVNQRTNFPSTTGNITPLIAAAEKNRLDMVKLLVEKGAKIETTYGAENKNALAVTTDKHIQEFLKSKLVIKEQQKPQDWKKYDVVHVDTNKCWVSGMSSCIGLAFQQLVKKLNPGITDCSIPYLQLSKNGLDLYFKDEQQAASLVPFLKYRDISSVSCTDALLKTEKFGSFPVKLTIKDFEDILSAIQDVCGFDDTLTRGLYSKNGLGHYYYKQVGTFDQIITLFSDYVEQNKNNFPCLLSVNAAEKFLREILRQKHKDFAKVQFIGKNNTIISDESFNQQDIDLLCIIASDFKLNNQQLKCFEFLLNKSKSPQLGIVCLPTTFEPKQHIAYKSHM